MADAEWTAWLARPIAEHEAIQDKVRATLKAHGIQAGRDMMTTMQMPAMPAELVIPAAVLEARREMEDEDAELWQHPDRIDH